jgi:amino acid permease
MKAGDKKFWFATATLIASTVGVGYYGLPFAISKAGLTAGLFFFILVTALMLLGNLLFGEVILRTHRRHQLVGYVNKYLGAWARKINLFVFWVAIYGGMIAIIIISGDFLANFLVYFIDLSPAVFSTIFLISITIVANLGLKFVSKLDLFVFSVIGVIVIFILTVGVNHINFDNFSFTISDYWFLPFGVILFSLSQSGLPLLREVLAGEEKKMRKAIILGTLLPATFYLVFALLVIGISGDITSPDAISGLQAFLGPVAVIIGSILGFITATTIFLNMATSLRESLEEDFKMKARWVWILALTPPYILFLSGIRNFVDIISLVGGVAVSAQLILMIFLYAKAKKEGERIPEYAVRIPNWALYLMMLVFAAGAFYTVIIK